MKRLRLLPSTVLFTALSACSPSETPSGGVAHRAAPVAGSQNVTGVVYTQNASGTRAPAALFYVKFCDDALPDGPFGGGSCFLTQTDAAGNYALTIDTTEVASYWAFAWNDSVYWGSATQSASDVALPIDPGNNSIDVLSRPRPLPPQALAPADGATEVPTRLLMTWSDGLDADRRTPGWPVVYDLYRNVVDQPEEQVAADLPCCSSPAELLGGTAYRFRVVAKMNTQVGAPGDPLYATSSPRFRFTTVAPTAPHLQLFTQDGVPIAQNGSFDFGTVAQNTPSTQTFVIHNPGGSALDVTGLSVPAGTGFSVNPSSLPPIDPGTSASFTVQLLSATGGPTSAQVTLTNNDPTVDPFHFQVRGDITVNPTPTITLETLGGTPIGKNTTARFGSTPVHTPIQQTFRVRNTGTASLSVYNVSAHLNFVVSSMPASPIAPGHSSQFTITFTAPAGGLYQGPVILSDNDPASNPFVFYASAIALGPRIQILSEDGVSIASGSIYAFPSTQTGTPLDRSFTLHNGGNQTLTVSPVGATGSAFSVIAQPAASVPPGGTTAFGVRLLSNVVGATSGRISFTTNDPNSGSIAFTVTGTVTPPMMAPGP